MINPNYERKYIPGTAISRGLTHCGSWKGKLVWVFILIATIGMAGYQIMGRMTQWSNAQALLVRSKSIKAHEDKNSAQARNLENSNLNGIQFPNLTICNLNPISINHAEEEELARELSHDVYGEFLYFTDQPEQIQDTRYLYTSVANKKLKNLSLFFEICIFRKYNL